MRLRISDGLSRNGVTRGCMTLELVVSENASLPALGCEFCAVALTASYAEHGSGLNCCGLFLLWICVTGPGVSFFSTPERVYCADFLGVKFADDVGGLFFLWLGVAGW